MDDNDGVEKDGSSLAENPENRLASHACLADVSSLSTCMKMDMRTTRREGCRMRGATLAHRNACVSRTAIIRDGKSGLREIVSS